MLLTSSPQAAGAPSLSGDSAASFAGSRSASAPAARRAPAATTTRRMSSTKSGAAYAFSPVPIARGLHYGAARKRQAGGAGLNRSGTGAGGRHGMASGAVRGLGRKVKPLRLQNGDSVYVDILCNACGFEQPPQHRRLRCDSCGRPLALLDTADAYAGKHTMENYTEQDAFTPASLARQERKMRRAIATDVPDMQERQGYSELKMLGGTSTSHAGGTGADATRATRRQTHQLVVMASSMNDGSSARAREQGGLLNKRSGLGPGARHGMSAGAVRHLPASTRNVRTHDGGLVTIDQLCRSCGFEQPPDWSGLRCQSCRLPLNQLGDLVTEHQFRAVGLKQALELKKKVARRQRSRKDEKYSPWNTSATHYDTDADAQVFGMSGPTIRSIVSSSQLDLVDEEEKRQLREERRRKRRANTPSVANVRAETNNVVGDWVCAIEAATGRDYFFNRRTRKATYTVPAQVAAGL